jgi:hypothetical protein
MGIDLYMMTRKQGLLIFFALVANCFAQTGTIDLTVQDPNGAALASSGTLARLSAGIVERFSTAADGGWVFPNLALGRYRLEISAQGFATQSVLINIDTPAILRLPITMAVNTDTVRVDVIEATPLPGVELLADQVAAPVQVLSAAELSHTGAASLSDALNQRINGVAAIQPRLCSALRKASRSTWTASA